MTDRNEKGHVSIEDLLALKRLERPAPEFWARFETELRQKQLTALVAKRRWWHRLPVMLAPRFAVPAGAAAIIAFTLVAVRVSGPRSIAVEPGAERSLVSVAVESLPATEVETGAYGDGIPVEVIHPSVPMVAQGAAHVSPAQMEVTESVHPSERPSMQSIAATLARLEQSEPELVNAMLSGRLSPVNRAKAAVASAPDDNGDSSSRYRLIARYADHSLSPEPAAPALVRERIARRLGDDVGDRISRIGVEGSRVSLKF